MRHTIVSALLSAVVLSPLAGASPIGNVPEERGIVWDSGNAVFDSAPPAPTVLVDSRAGIIEEATKTTKKTRSKASRPAPTVPAAAPTAPAAGAPPAAAPPLGGGTGTLGAPAGTITWGARKRQEDDETIGQPDSTTTLEPEDLAPSTEEEPTVDTRKAITNDKKPPPKWGNTGNAGKPLSGKKPQSARPDPNPGPLPQTPYEAQGVSYTPPNTPPQLAPEASAQSAAAPLPLPPLPPLPPVAPQPAQQAAPQPAPKPTSQASPQAQGGSPVIYSPDGSAALQLSDSSLTFFPASGGSSDTIHSGQSSSAGSGSISNQISKRAIIDSPRPGVVQGLNIAGSSLTFFPSKGGSTTVSAGSSHPHGKRDDIEQELSIESSTLTFYPSEGGSTTVTATGSGLQKEGKREEKFVA